MRPLMARMPTSRPCGSGAYDGRGQRRWDGQLHRLGERGRRHLTPEPCPTCALPRTRHEPHPLCGPPSEAICGSSERPTASGLLDALRRSRDEEEAPAERPRVNACVFKLMEGAWADDHSNAGGGGTRFPVTIVIASMRTLPRRVSTTTWSTSVSTRYPSASCSPSSRRYLTTTRSPGVHSNHGSGGRGAPPAFAWHWAWDIPALTAWVSSPGEERARASSGAFGAAR